MGEKELTADKQMQNRERENVCGWDLGNQNIFTNFTTQPRSLPQWRIVFPNSCCSLFLTTQTSANPCQTLWTLCADRIISSVTRAETWHLKMGWNFIFSFFFRSSVGGENFFSLSFVKGGPTPLALPLGFSLCVSLTLSSHESDRSGALWPLYRHKDCIEIGRGSQASTHHNSLSSTQYFLSSSQPPHPYLTFSPFP